MLSIPTSSMKNLLLILFVLVAAGCSNRSRDDLNSNSTIISIFSTSEIEDLNRILSFFENQICSDKKHAHTETCYKSYLKKVSENIDKGSIVINIPYEEQKVMFEQLNDSTFNQIWSYGEVTNQKTKDTLIELGYNPSGKYVKMMNEMSHDDNLMKYYYETWDEWRSLQIITSGKTLENYETYDIDDIRMKLVVAIHYLTMNDNFERNRLK